MRCSPPLYKPNNIYLLNDWNQSWNLLTIFTWNISAGFLWNGKTFFILDFFANFLRNFGTNIFIYKLTFLLWDLFTFFSMKCSSLICGLFVNWFAHFLVFSFAHLLLFQMTNIFTKTESFNYFNYQV